MAAGLVAALSFPLAGAPASNAEAPNWSAPELVRAASDSEFIPAMPSGGFGLVFIAGELDAPPSIALNANGDAEAIWSETTMNPNTFAPHELVRVAQRPAGGRWGAPITLEQWTREGAAQNGLGGWAPRIALAADDEALAVWEAPSGIRAAVQHPGSPWQAQPLTPPSTTLPPGAEEAQIAAAVNGEAVAVWPHEVPEDNAGLGHSDGIEAAVRAPAGSFASAQTISAAENAWQPSVATNEGGDLVVAWTVYEEDGCSVVATSRRAGSGWGVPVALASNAECQPAQPAVDAAGEAAVMWSTGRTLQVAEMQPDGRWGAPSVVARPRGEFPRPHFAMGADGSAAVTWGNSGLESKPGLWVRLRSSDRRWHTPRKLSRVDPGVVALAIDPRGDAMLAWEAGKRLHLAAHPLTGTWSSRTLGVRPRWSPAYGTIHALPVVEFGPGGAGLIAWRTGAGIETIWNPAPFG